MIIIREITAPLWIRHLSQRTDILPALYIVHIRQVFMHADNAPIFLMIIWTKSGEGVFSFTNEELTLSVDVGCYGYQDRERGLRFKLRSPIPGLFPCYLWKPWILALSYFRKRQLSRGKNSCHQPHKRWVSCPPLLQKEGNEYLVLTGNKKNLAKPLWDRNIFPVSFRNRFNPFSCSLPVSSCRLDSGWVTFLHASVFLSVKQQ